MSENNALIGSTTPASYYPIPLQIISPFEEPLKCLMPEIDPACRNPSVQVTSIITGIHLESSGISEDSNLTTEATHCLSNEVGGLKSSFELSNTHCDSEGDQINCESMLIDSSIRDSFFKNESDLKEMSSSWENRFRIVKIDKPESLTQEIDLSEDFCDPLEIKITQNGDLTALEYNNALMELTHCTQILSCDEKATSVVSAKDVNFPEIDSNIAFSVNSETDKDNIGSLQFSPVRCIPSSEVLSCETLKLEEQPPFNHEFSYSSTENSKNGSVEKVKISYIKNQVGNATEDPPMFIDKMDRIFDLVLSHTKYISKKELQPLRNKVKELELRVFQLENERRFLLSMAE